MFLDASVEAERPEETEATNFRDDVTAVAVINLTPCVDAAYAPLTEFVTALDSSNRGNFVMNEATRPSSLAIGVHPVSIV